MSFNKLRASFILLIITSFGLAGISPAYANPSCEKEVMSGKINWGGGTTWNQVNAKNLCAGSIVSETIRCFEAGIAQGLAWGDAIKFCKAGSRHCVNQQNHKYEHKYEVGNSKNMLSNFTKENEVFSWQKAFNSCGIGSAPR